MINRILYTAGNTAALRHARQQLTNHGFLISDTPAPDVTHLLLPVPSFEADRRIKGGGILEHILADLPENVTVIGGNLQHPSLAKYATIDLLQDPVYLAQNAAITADCAIRIAAANLPVTFSGTTALIIGWGRIGKCLANQLQAIGVKVTVAARKQADRAMLQALGFGAADPTGLEGSLPSYRMIFNTAPELILSKTQLASCRSDCILIDLASKQGIESSKAIWARGLPGKDTPESSGKLIAETVIRLLTEKEAVK